MFCQKRIQFLKLSICHHIGMIAEGADSEWKIPDSPTLLRDEIKTIPAVNIVCYGVTDYAD